MKEEKGPPFVIEVPDAAHQMTPKQIIVLMRGLGVGKRNYAPPHHARAWTTGAFLDACTRSDVTRWAKTFPPERTTVDAWFSPRGPLPDDRRPAWHYFFHVFFADSRRAYGTQAWKEAYFAALKREKIADARGHAFAREVLLPLAELPQGAVSNVLPLIRGTHDT